MTAQLSRKFRKTLFFKGTQVNNVPIVSDLKTGSWAGVSEEGLNFIEAVVAGKYENKDLTIEEEQLLSTLLDIGILEEKEPLPFTKEDELKRLMPHAAYFHVSFKCNLLCPTCYSFDDRRNNHPDLSTEEAKLIFRKLRHGSISDLIISGGEPFSRRDMIELLEYCKKDLGFENLVIITNGTLLNEKSIERLKGITDQVAVSLDGYNEETNAPIRGKGNFARAVQAIGLLKKHNIPSHVITTLHKKNINEADKYLEFADDLGIKVNFSMFTPSGKGNENTEDLNLSVQDLEYVANILVDSTDKAKILETPCAEGLEVKDRCGIGTYLISVNSDGTVYPCHITMLPQFAMGNLLQNELPDIMYNSKIAEQCRDLNVETVGRCSSCEVKMFCGGGCRANALYAENDISAHDPHCSLNKTFLHGAFNRVFS